MLKFGRVVFEICERTDRQTDKQTYSSLYVAPFPRGRNVEMHRMCSRESANQASSPLVAALVTSSSLVQELVRSVCVSPCFTQHFPAGKNRKYSVSATKQTRSAVTISSFACTAQTAVVKVRPHDSSNLSKATSRTRGNKLLRQMLSCGRILSRVVSVFVTRD